MSTGTVSLTPEALQAMIATAVATAIQESKKPAPLTDQQIAAEKMRQEHRANTAADVVRGIEGKRAAQMACTHEHSRREGGGSHCVYVKEENPASPGFVLCQKCQGRFRSGEYNAEGPAYCMDRGAIYDTARFNKLFQDCFDGGLLNG